MDPFYNNNSGYNNASHHPSSSNQPLNQPNANFNNVSVQPTVPHTGNVTGVVAPQGSSIAGTNYASSYNPQANANNAQYRMAAPAAGHPMQQTAYGGQQSIPNMSQQTNTSYVPSPSRQHHQQQQMYNPRATNSTTAGMGSPAANHTGYVPNPLGLGGTPVAAVGGGPAQQSSSSNAGQQQMGASKKDLLRSLYQSRQRTTTQPAAASQPAPQLQQQGQANSVYRPQSGGIHHQVQSQGVQQHQVQQSQHRVAAPSAPAYTNNVQIQAPSQPQQNVLQQGISTYQQSQQQRPSSSQPMHISQGGGGQLQQSSTPVQRSSYSQPSPMHQQQVMNSSLSQQQQVYRQQQSVQQQQPNYSQQKAVQQQPNYNQQAIQQQQMRTSSSSQPQQQVRQQLSTSSSSQPQQHQSSQSSSQPGQQQQQQQKKAKFHLTPEAKVALREAVLSAIRHPQGTVDPACLQRAMAQGLPEKAILNAAHVARQRDAKNRSLRQQQQQQGSGVVQRQIQGQVQVQQRTNSSSISGQQQQSMSQQPRQPQTLQQVHQQQQQSAFLNQSRTATSSYPQPSNTSANTQMQQRYPAQPSQQNTMYANQQQQQQQQSRIYQQRQQQQQTQQQQVQRQQQIQKQQQQAQQMTTYQRQLQAQQANMAAQRKAQEDARIRQQQQKLQAQQQQRMLNEQRKKKEMEAAKAAAEERALKHSQLVSRMKGWGRTGCGLVVKGSAKGLPKQLQHPGQKPVPIGQGLLPQSTWGGVSMCSDNEPALVGALKRATTEVKDGRESQKLQHPPKIQAAIAMIRKQLLKHPQTMLEENNKPATKEELRRKRTAAISNKLLDPKQCNTILKRVRVQPKREPKFLDKHIRRARQMTADGLSKRHKELLKAIVTHQSEFYKFHRLKKNECAKIARAIREQHRKAESAKEKEVENAEKARLAALRANDMTAYTSLLEDTKNERLKFLLDKTDECMNQISTLLASRAAEEEEDIKQRGGEGMIKAQFTNQVVKAGSYYDTAHVKSEQVRQPSILTGGDLKEYQLGGLQWMVSLYNNRLNGILADEMGLGKTIQTIALIAYLIEAKQNLGPYLVIVPLSTLSNWVNEFAKWLPAATVVCYKGSPQQRKALFRDEVADGHFNVLLTTYEFVIRDKGSLSKIAWQYAIVDEGHRMKNNQSKFAVTLATNYNTRRRVLLTGTPMQNNLPELWALLNFLLPAIFNSAETFDTWFNKPFSSFGKTGNDNGEDSSNELLSNEERMLIIHRLHELLRPFMLRRVKSEVLDQLPEKVEKVIRCELSSWQKELYKQISHKVAGEAATKNFNRGLNNVVMQLRKVCNHPYLFTNEGYHINEDIIRTSGKMELMDRMLPKLKAAGHRVLMFTQMTKMMPILEDYFAFRGFSSLRLDGSTSADEREKRMYMFNAPDSPYFIFLLSTRAGGLGLNLATADTVIIFDSDWNPMMDLQAQDRAHRIGQKKDVRVFRIITQTPVEEKILSRATEKLQMNELVVEAGKFDKSGQRKDDNSLERLKMMELLLTDFDENQNAQGTATTEENFENQTDDGEEEEEDSKNLLNEMISSNDDDYKLYCKMDFERTNAPALYSDVNDCPDWIRYPNGKGAELVDDSQPEVLGKRRAAAGDIVYDDGLTEKQFCRMMDKKSIEEEKSKKKKGKRKINDLDTSLILENDGGGRKRGKTELFEVDDSSSRSKIGFSSASGGNDEITPAMYERLSSVTKSVIYFKDKSTKRKLSEIFLEKPCPQTYPDYYQIIEKPIGMNDIQRKCRAKLYTTLKDFRDDWNTLFKNAKTYNGEGSWIVNDAEVLRGELDKLMDKNFNANAAAPKKPVRIKLSLKMGSKKKKKKGGDEPSDMTY